MWVTGTIFVSYRYCWNVGYRYDICFISLTEVRILLCASNKGLICFGYQKLKSQDQKIVVMELVRLRKAKFVVETHLYGTKATLSEHWLSYSLYITSFVLMLTVIQNIFAA